ncbi:MAG: hypothetical protein ACPGTU_11840, partial [Myxococcota bacterium]
TLFSMATRKTPMDLFAADLDPEMLNAVPDPLLSLIRKSTRYNREERYPSAQAMLDAVRLRQSQADTVPTPIRTAPPVAITVSEPQESDRPPANETFVAESGPDADMALAASVTPPPFRPSSIPDPASLMTMDEDATILPDDLQPPHFDIANPPKNRDRTVLVLIAIMILMVGGLVKRILKTTSEDDNAPMGQLADNLGTETQTQPATPPIEVVPDPTPVEATPPTPPPVSDTEDKDDTPASPPPEKADPDPVSETPETKTPTAPTDPEVELPLDEETESDPPPVATPMLVHVPAKMARMGSTMFVTAQIKNLSPVELRMYEAIAYFRTEGTARWTRSVMTRERSTWSTPIPITPDMERGLEYVIKAKPRDSMGGKLQPLVSGTNKNPHDVRITSP